MNDFFKITAVVLLGLTMLCCFTVAATYQIECPGDLARIEQLRSDVKLVKSNQDEDVIGQVAAWNQTIKSRQRYLQTWYGSFIIPSAWSDVKIIEINSQ